MSPPKPAHNVVTFDGIASKRKLFAALQDGGYGLTLVDEGLRFEARYLRRDHGELHGELTVYCEWPGARTFEGVLGTGCWLNFSSSRALTERAKYLGARASAQVKVGEFDWLAPLEEFGTRIKQAEQRGEPARCLDDVPDASTRPDFLVDGLRLPSDSTTLWQADGGSMKSYLALYVAAKLVEAGSRILYVDFEWSAWRHKQRKLRLFGTDRLEGLFYVKGIPPLSTDITRLVPMVRELAIDYVIVDSVVPALDGRPEDSDVAQRFFGATGRFPGVLALAHVTKGEAMNPEPGKTPQAFGSRFFHNLARATYYLKKDEDGLLDRVTVGCYPDKDNEGKRDKAVGFEFQFSGRDGPITVTPVDLLSVGGDLARELPIRDRIRRELARGMQTIQELAETLGCKENSIRVAVLRDRSQLARFTSADGVERIGLKAGKPYAGE